MSIGYNSIESYNDICDTKLKVFVKQVMMYCFSKGWGYVCTIKTKLHSGGTE